MMDASSTATRNCGSSAPGVTRITLPGWPSPSVVKRYQRSLWPGASTRSSSPVKTSVAPLPARKLPLPVMLLFTRSVAVEVDARRGRQSADLVGRGADLERRVGVREEERLLVRLLHHGDEHRDLAAIVGDDGGHPASRDARGLADHQIHRAVVVQI